MSRLTRDGTAEPVSRDQILRHARGQGNIIFHVQLTTSRIGNLTRLIHTLLYVTTIPYIYSYRIKRKRKRKQARRKGETYMIHGWVLLRTLPTYEGLNDLPKPPPNTPTCVYFILVLQY